ncbi:MAG: transketolase C-terminal domain-containing protein [Alphaproteobacteria bacterium]
MRRTALREIHALARRDPRVLFIGSDLGAGTLDEFRAEFPERFLMEGIAEQNIIGMAAGLAMEGFVPYVNTIATFLTRRCLEQVAVDLCLHRLPVRLIGNGGGLVYAALGPTHIAAEDIALMRALPNMTVVVPADGDEMARLIPQTLDWPGPVYIRLARGGDPVVSRPGDSFEIGKAILLREPGEVLLIAAGVMVARALEAAQALAADGVECGVLNLHTIKPLDKERILGLTSGVDLVVTIEEHSRVGGLGSAVAELMLEQAPGRLPKLRRLAIPDAFTEQYGSQAELLESLGLAPRHIAAEVRQARAA